ncbi:MAG: hypothetical protein OEW66_02300 [Actinomycetota bacterium]|nr:hypothetical protein [Actinomycetota bacterium]
MIASDPYMVAFRIVHILAGVGWVGSVFLFVVYVQPSAAAIAPAGAPLMAELLGRRRLVDGILTMAVISVVGGAFLYWRDWQDFGSFGDWISSSFGSALTLGAVASLVTLFIGVFVTRPNVMRLLALGRQVAESGGPPTPELAAEIESVQVRLRVFARLSLGLLVLAVAAMASARYV